MKIGGFRWLLLSFVLFPLLGTAMKPYTPTTADPLLEPWRWRHEEVLEGLGVLCMAEAPDGSVWFGNTGSIAHYDGMSLTTIPFDDDLLSKITHHKQTPWANALTILPSGDLLVLIGESLVLRSGDQWRVILYDVGPSVFTANLQQATDGSCWLLVPGALWRVSQDLKETSKVMMASPSGFLGSFCHDAAGNVWVVEKVGSRQSRLVWIPIENGEIRPSSEWREYPVPYDSDAAEIQIVARQDGLIEYADSSIQNRFATFNPHRNEWTSGDPQSPAMRSFSLSAGHGGTLWSGGEKTLIRISLDGSLIHYPSAQLQLPTVPLSLMETRNQRLWVIGRIGYVYSVDIGDREWSTYERLHFECETPSGVQWFKSKQKDVAVSHDPSSGKWWQYQLSDGLIDTINGMIASRQGWIWAAGSHEGRAALAVFDGKRWSRFVHPEFAEWIEPKAMLEAADGTIWMGAGGTQFRTFQRSGGALQYAVDRNGTITCVKHHAPPDFPYYVTSLAQAPDETLWIGSTVLHRYDPSSQTARQLPEFQGLNTIDIAFDQQATQWVAKEHAGVYRYQTNQWTQFATQDGLAGINLSDLLVLRDQTVLAASGFGISRFDGDSWTTHAFPQEWSLASRWSGMRESRDGSIWFNVSDREAQSAQLTVNQTERFYTVRHIADTDAPDTHVTAWLDRVAQPGNCHISWSAQDPWSCTPREMLQYSWRLDEGSWSAFSSESSWTFLNLDSGQHRLEVRARDQAFNVDPTPDAIDFEVIPPVWQQGWFIGLLLVWIGLLGFLLRMLMRTRERHLLEQQQARELHLQELDRMKTGFFTNISHELRTPITVIQGRLDRLMSDEKDEDRKQSLVTLQRNARRVATLVTQLLDFRKIEEGKLAMEASVGDLAASVREWVESLQPLAELSQSTCILECVPECRGRFDFDKLQKIVTNLVSNSIKYTQAAGTVRVMLQARAEDRVVRFIVEDDGIGISAEHLPHIFERFYRVPESSMAVGAGIGLNLTQELVSLLGGDIRVESPIHHDSKRPGTRFTVTLPMEPVNDKPVELEQPNLQVVSPASPEATDESFLLVVEDDEDIRQLLKEGLSSLYRVEIAENGAIGLQLAKERVPDLIISDVMMPVMDGVTLCRHVKASMETSHIPVILLTAKSSLEYQMEGLKTGADDYVIKPFSMDLLLVRIANLLESRRHLREKFGRDFAVVPRILPDDAPDKEFLDKAMRVLEEHSSNWEFKTEQFADELHMSLRSLQRKIKAVTNRSPKEFINDFRMARAAERLIQTSDTIAEISFQVGMDEPTNFTRLFKTQYQMTPTEYRAQNKSS